MIIPVRLKNENYDIVIERGAIKEAGQLLNLDRRVFIVTDSGVPKEYAECISRQCKISHVERIPEGEKSKSMEMFEKLLSSMLEFGMSRGDCVIAVGGGVAGDLSGFAAACYMRGIDFYNIPTTLLAQVDSSVGGKTAIDFSGIKNLVGAFHQPEKVIIDVETLKTLSSRLLHEGFAEIIKMAMTSDKKMFDDLQSFDWSPDLGKEENLEFVEKIIEQAVRIKVGIVEQDEKDAGLRQVLNFGHTFGHAIESLYGDIEESDKNTEKKLNVCSSSGSECSSDSGSRCGSANNSDDSLNSGSMLHGECVALGMLPMCESNVRRRLTEVLKKYALPCEFNLSANDLMPYVRNDKKKTEAGIRCVFVKEIGKYEFEKRTEEELRNMLNSY